MTRFPTKPKLRVMLIKQKFSGPQSILLFSYVNLALPFSSVRLLLLLFSYSVQSVSSGAQSCPTLCVFSHSVVFNSLQTDGLQETNLSCSSPSPGACSNSCPLSWWYHSTISTSVVPFFSHFQSVPTSVFSDELALHISWPKYWSFNFSISLSNVYSGLISFRNDWLDLLEVQGTLKRLLKHHSQKHQLFSAQPSLWSNSHIPTWLLEKP